MGNKKGGALALLAGAGPMGLGAIDYAVHCDRKPALLVVTDLDDARLARAASIVTPEEAAKNGVRLIYVNNFGDPIAELRGLNKGKPFDDVLVMAPVKAVVEMADRLLGTDGCLNFFAGPTDTTFSALLNFYDVHYESHHLVGTSGGNTDDMKESLDMMARGKLNPVALVTHVGGLNAVAETTINLDKIPGGKKLIYTHKNIPLTAIADFAEKGKSGDALFAELGRIVEKHNMLWCKEAEDYLLKTAADI
jgi:threonine dehydrogenase-like Zn-dependent dehydrogenase